MFRAVVLGALTALICLGLANVFGERPVADGAVSPSATLGVSAPTAVRGGLFFQGRFTIEARRPLEHATLVLDRGWFEQLSVNTIEPSPVGEVSRGGKLLLDFGAVRAGRTLVVAVQFQVNPAQFGRRSQSVELRDGDRRLLRIHRTLTVFP